jgi:DNA-binding IclR family transcriptional regulator
MSSQRKAILIALEEADEPLGLGPNEIAAAAGLRPDSVRHLLDRLVKDGLVEKVERGRYRSVERSHVHKGVHNEHNSLL